MLSKTNLKQAHEWINENTPQNALFLTAPNNYSFNCEAQRSTVVNYKAIVHETQFLLNWKQAMEKYYAVNFKTLQKLTCLPTAVKGFYSFNFANYPFKEVEYVLLEKQKNKVLKYTINQVLYENAEYLVLKMK